MKLHGVGAVVTGASRGLGEALSRELARRGARVVMVARGKAELEWGSYIPPQHFRTIPGFETAPMAYTSDIPLLGRWGTPLLFGPGSITVAHTPEEFVAVSELRAAVDSYGRIARTLLSS